MADNKTGGGPGDGGQPTLTEYKKSQARVRELVEKRRMLDRKLVRGPSKRPLATRWKRLRLWVDRDLC